MTQENLEDVHKLIAQTEAGELEWVYVEESKGFMLDNRTFCSLHLCFTPAGMMLGIIRAGEGYLTPLLYGDVLHCHELELLLRLTGAIMSSFDRRIQIEVRARAHAMTRQV
jgi:hypothetical protein